MDYEVKQVIAGAVSSIAEQVLWHLSEETLHRDRVHELVYECDGNECATIGLSLEQMIQAIEAGVDECDLGDLRFQLDGLRSSLESYAVLAIHRLAESRAASLFEDLFDLMDENDLEPEQMRQNNPLGWLTHRSERDERSDCTVYEYRNVEEPGRHIDMWEVRLSSGDRVWLFDELDGES